MAKRTEREPMFHQLPSDINTVRMYASRPMRRGAGQAGNHDLSWANNIDENSPAYAEAVERTIKALKDWEKKREIGRSS